MRNPTRRNRNIGTTRQGHGQKNKMVIPAPCHVSLSFYERLEHYRKEERVINDHTFLFVTEATTTGSAHACSIDDVAGILSHIPVADYGELKLIIFRQPKRKEELLSPVWGRLIYSYEFEGSYHPAVIIEACCYPGKVRWTKKLCHDDQQELARLREDGHPIITDKRHHTITRHLPAVRNTQLHRTLLHEIGHYRHYLDMVPATDIEEKGWDAYLAIPKQEKETFAHRYASRMREQLIAAGIIQIRSTPPIVHTPRKPGTTGQ